MQSLLHWPRSLAFAVLLLTAFFLQLFFSSRLKSPAWDEAGHIASGVAYVQRGSLAVNPQHPPLLKVLSGLSLTLAGVHWPAVPQAEALLHGAGQWQWSIGSLMLIQNDTDRALQWARLPLMLVSVMGGLVLFLWTRQLAGDLAALCALALYILDPTIAAHSILVTLDVGLGAFTLLFLLCLWTYVRTPRLPMLAISGVTLGLALCTKFSSLVLLPLAALLVIAGSYRRTAAIQAAPGDPCPCGSGKKFKNCHALQKPGPVDLQWLIFCARSLAVLYAIAAVVVTVLYRFHGPGAYWAGAASVNADHDDSYLHYLAGNLSPGFPNYFAIAYLLKEPLAAIALAAAGLFFLLRDKALPLRDKLFVLLPPAVLFAAHVWKADDIGVRYIIPCLPFTYLLGGIAAAKLMRTPGLAPRIAIAVLGAWSLVAAVGIYPDGLSYFNESACLLTEPGKIGLDGGSRCGIAWLDDSNVDWGSGLKQAAAWLARNAPGRSALVDYFGSFPLVGYDAPLQEIENAKLMFQPGPGLYFVSANVVARNSAQIRAGFAGGDDWMSRIPPRAFVGHCLYLYDIPARTGSP